MAPYVIETMGDGLRVHLIEDDALYVEALTLASARERRSSTLPILWQVSRSGAQAQACLREHGCDVIVLDVHLLGGEQGIALLPALRALAPEAPILVHSVLSDYETVVRAMRAGAFDYLPKQAGVQALLARLHDLAQLRSRASDSAVASPTLRAFGPTPAQSVAAPGTLLGTSRAIVALKEHIEQVRPGLGGVLITGASGSGKELVARALAHEGRPFVAVDAATLSGPMGLATLLGHERGAYTGAEGARPGLLERAHGGVLFIDEVANMPLDVQAQLLRALEQRTTTRLGGLRERTSLFRLISATHSDLPALCERGLFRFDLLMRMRVFALEVPPLCERAEDIVPLFVCFLRRFGCQASLSEEVRAHLLAHSWPGNVRELLHAAEHAATLCTEEILDAAALPAHVRSLPHNCAPQGLQPHAQANEARSYHQQMADYAQHLLRKSYETNAGNITRMAHKLGLERAFLHHKLCQLGIHRPRRRGAHDRATP